MLVVDTDVIVRLIINDDPRQSASVRRLLEQHDIWIGVTVLLEAAWVVESVYELTVTAKGDRFIFPLLSGRK